MSSTQLECNWKNETALLSDDEDEKRKAKLVVVESSNSNSVMQTHSKLSQTGPSSLVFNVESGSHSVYGTQHHHQHHHNNAGDRNNLLDLPSRPQIDWSNENYRPIFEPGLGDRNVTAQLGKSTFLRCRIKQITDETVSWKITPSVHLQKHGAERKRKDAVDAQWCDLSNLSWAV